VRRVVVGFSGGVTSAWCAGWALRTYPRDEVVLLFHDTLEEHRDTYRFLREMAAVLGLPITERSDGRSVTEVFRDEGYLGNNQNAMCSRILKVEPGRRYFEELRLAGVDEIVKVLGFSAREPRRVGHAVARGEVEGYACRFPVVEEGVTKQDTVEWCLSVGVAPSAMYCWSEHANCVGCVKGGMAYWKAVEEHAPEVYAQREALEDEFGHNILRGGDRAQHTLRELRAVSLRRKVAPREAIEVGACGCGD
jgi:hypothetical protein